MSGRDDGFLERWSRRKRAIRDADDEEPLEAGQNRREEAELRSMQVEAPEPDETASLSDAELCERLGLPYPDTLNRGDDFKIFLAAGVPGRLRNLALRRLWRVNPALGALDDLIDYAEDFSEAATALGDAGTTYEVGRGLKAHVDMLRQAEEAEAAAGEDAGDADTPDGSLHEPAGELADAENGDDTEPGNAAVAPAPTGEAGKKPGGEEAPPARAPHLRETSRDRPRHMVFRRPDDADS